MDAISDRDAAFLVNGMLTNLFSHILTVSASMSAVIGLAFLLLHIYGKSCAARTRYLVWTILILRLCIPFGTLVISPLYTLEVTTPEVPEREVHAAEAAAETEPEWVQ